jgi:hypothetical protein
MCRGKEVTGRKALTTAVAVPFAPWLLDPHSRKELEIALFKAIAKPGFVSYTGKALLPVPIVL